MPGWTGGGAMIVRGGPDAASGVGVRVRVRAGETLLGGHIRGIRVIYASNMLRAATTASIIAAQAGGHPPPPPNPLSHESAPPSGSAPPPPVRLA